MTPDSPLLVRLLSRLLPPDLDHLSGDLEEEFNAYCDAGGRAQAHVALTLQVLNSLPFLVLEIIKWNVLMLAHYLKTGLRVIRRHVAYSIINVAGLAAGMAVCLLILLFIVDQRSYDRFHEDASSIYRVTSQFQRELSDTPGQYATSPAGLGDELRESLPGASQVTEVRRGFRGEIVHNGEPLSIGGIYAGPDFLDLFDFELTRGDRTTALTRPGSILLTPEIVTRLFGPDADPVGRTITALGDMDYTVTGVIQTPGRSHIRFESIVSHSSLEAGTSWRDGLNNAYTYVRLDDEAAESAPARLANLVDRAYTTPADANYRLKSLELQPITQVNLGAVHFNEVGMVIPGFIGWFLAAFGAVIMLIAGFNYVSLTIARSINRSREIGVRRTMGALKSSIFRQFLFESILMAMLALVFSFIIMTWMLPHFNSLFLINLTDGRIGFDFLKDARIYLMFFGFSIVVGLLAGFYPARLFTAVEPVRALGGARYAGRLSRQTLRKVITVAQFTFALIFIITTAVLLKQYRFMAETDYGFDHGLVVNVALQDIPYERFRSAFAGDAETVSIAASSKVPALGSTSGLRVRSEAVAEDVLAHEFLVDANYIEAMGLQLIDGRNFDPALASDSSEAAILGRSAVTALGLGSPDTAVGASIRVQEDPSDRTYTVIGVIEDFITNNPAAVGDPLILRNRPSEFRYAVVKVADGQLHGFVSRLNSEWVGLGSVYTPKYEIFDEQLENNPMFVVFTDFMRVLGVIAVFALLISCLGLLGMAMYSARNRVREIGIRKVLGATPGSLVVNLSREYFLLIGLAVLIGAPLAWLLNSFWLAQLTNAVEMGPAVFVAGIGATTTVALAAVASQTVRAARAGVVDNLRTE